MPKATITFKHLEVFFLQINVWPVIFNTDYNVLKKFCGFYTVVVTVFDTRCQHNTGFCDPCHVLNKDQSARLNVFFISIIL